MGVKCRERRGNCIKVFKYLLSILPSTLQNKNVPSTELHFHGQAATTTVSYIHLFYHL